MFTQAKNIYLSYRLKKYVCKLSSGLSGLAKKSILRMENHVSLGNVSVYGSVTEIGAYSYVRSGSAIYGKCIIGRFCSIGHNVVIGLEKNKHPIDWLTTSLFSKKLEKIYQYQETTTTIGHDCWIGRGATIMDGLSIGNGAVIAAGAIVTSNVPPYAVVAGIPAKVIKYRFNETFIKTLEQSVWWEYSPNYLETLDISNPEGVLDKLDGNTFATYDKLEIGKAFLFRVINKNAGS